jgi:hypothetical protein
MFQKACYFNQEVITGWVWPAQGAAFDAAFVTKSNP